MASESHPGRQSIQPVKRKKKKDWRRGSAGQYNSQTKVRTQKAKAVIKGKLWIFKAGLELRPRNHWCVSLIRMCEESDHRFILRYSECHYQLVFWGIDPTDPKLFKLTPWKSFGLLNTIIHTNVCVFFVLFLLVLDSQTRGISVSRLCPLSFWGLLNSCFFF